MTAETLAFAAALAYLKAHPWLRDPLAGKNALRFNLMCEAGLDVTDDDELSHERLRFTGEHPENVIALATAGDSIAHEALCDVADHLAKCGKTLPPALQRYVIAAARHPKPSRRGRHPVSNIHRDEAIFHAVQLAVGMGLRPTRSVASSDDRESACSVVARALTECDMAMSEQAVVSVWTKRRCARERAGFRAVID